MRKIMLLIFLFLISLAYASITIDYKNEYLEPGKAYDIWVIVVPDNDVNNTVVGIKPYGESKEYIKVVGKSYKYLGSLFQGERGIGHFIIKIDENAPSKDYEIVAYYNYTYKGIKYYNSRIFKIPVRGVPNVVVEVKNNNINLGKNLVYVIVKNIGTGVANDIKITFNPNNGISSLNNIYINSLKPKESLLYPVNVIASKVGMLSLPYKLVYKLPFDNLVLTQKTVSGDDEQYTYSNVKTITSSGYLTFLVSPIDKIEVYPKTYNIYVNKLENLTLVVKNNYKDGYIKISIKRAIGSNEKTIYLKKGEKGEVSFIVKFDKTGLYNIPIEISTNTFTTIKNITLNVIGKPEIIITGLSVKSELNKIVITGDVDNIGSGTAKSVVVKAKDKSYFVGSLEPDDYGSFTLKVYNNKNKIPLIVEFKDENGNLIKIEKNISVTLVNKVESKNNFLFLIIGLIFLAFVIFIVYKVLKGRKNDNSEECLEDL
ncbi:COG1361 S-layer family protein [Methanocaldococcus sp.]